MPNSTAALASLNQRRVAVQILSRGREHMLVGSGDYQIDPDLGGVLRVHSDETDSDVELLFVEDAWNGEIRRGHGLGCDFLIRLGS